MRKQIAMFALAAGMLLTATTAQAKIDFGVKGGLNVTNMSLSNDVLDASNRTGFFFGPTMKFTLPIIGLGVDASALYDQRSAKVENAGEEDKTIKQQQIAIPVNLRYGFGLGDLASLYFFGGPQWGINVGDKNFNWSKASNYEFRKSNFSVNLGAGLMLASHLQLSANYNIACGKTADVTWSSAASTVSDQVTSKSKSRNNSWQISLAYYF